MSVYWVAMWTVIPDAVAEHDTNALPLLLDHVRSEHPRVLAARTWTVLWGAEPARPGRIWIEEFASLTSIDEVENEEMGPACDAAWQAIHRLAMPGTFRTAIWTDPLRDRWKDPIRYQVALPPSRANIGAARSSRTRWQARRSGCRGFVLS